MTDAINQAYTEYEIMENPALANSYLEHLTACAEAREFEEMHLEIIEETKGY